MSDIAVRMDHVWKKFRKGELHDSLRDLIPALAKRLIGRTPDPSDARQDFWALRDISFEVPRGEAFGIIGSNGAGKSTMLKLLSRIMKPTLGTFEVEGRLSALIEVAAGFHPDLTGRENVMLTGAIYGMSKQEILSKFDEIVNFSGLDEFIDTPVKRYSSGMYARLGFSVAAHVSPDVLIVDEVLSVGDYAFQKRCIDRMQEIIRSGATVLFVSHNVKAMTELCSRCLLLDHGRVVTIGPSGDVVRAYIGEAQEPRAVDSSQDVVISRITVRNQAGECLRFESGEKAWIDVELTAYKRSSKLSVTIYVTDEQSQNIFDTSTERLGHGNFTLDAGEVFRCTFELSLNLANGTFHPSILVYRYDTQTEFDRWAPATTIYVSSDQDVRGIANCFPKLIRQEIHGAPDGDLAGISEDASDGRNQSSG